MDTPEDRQQLEITALKSIYDENFIECPPPKAWKVRTLQIAVRGRLYLTRAFCLPARQLTVFGLVIQGAARLPEFVIRVHHPDEQYAAKVCFDLHIRYVELLSVIPMLCSA